MIGRRRARRASSISDVSGGNVLARWRRSSGESSDMQLRAYYDYTRRDDPSFHDTLHTFDLDFQQRFTASDAPRNHVGRELPPHLQSQSSGGIFAVDPEESDDQLFSGFIQDQMTLTDSLRLTLGTKLEDNDFSGFEVQPSVRVAWSPREDQTLWSAVSRAVRVPTRTRARHRHRGHASRRQPRHRYGSATTSSRPNG